MKRLVTLRFIKKQRNRERAAICLVVVLVGLLGAATTMYRALPPRIDPTAYRPLLDTIAEGESKGNYNAYYGHGDNMAIHFTNMTIMQVMHWQKQYVADGSPSSAVGRYQIIRPTLAGLVEQLGIDPTTSLYDQAMQDKLAITLIERRGALEFVEKKISPEQFAANLAKEWASLPRMTGPDPAASFYAGDGLNAAHISISTIQSAVDQLSQQ